jgi:hypothetical protein
MEMKKFVKTVGAVAALAVLGGVLHQVTRAEEPKVPPSAEEFVKALADAGQPGAEHKKLQPFVGNWNFTMKLWTDPSQPPAELKGTIERKWIMDGRFVQETAHGECAKTGKSFEGMGILGYDSARKKFSMVKICGLCGTVSSSLASSDSKGTRFECGTEECCPLSGEMIKGRDELLVESNDRIVLNVYKTINDREVKVGEMVTIRQR